MTSSAATLQKTSVLVRKTYAFQRSFQSSLCTLEAALALSCVIAIFSHIMARLPKIYVLIRSTTILVSSFAILTFLSRRSYIDKDDKLESVDNNKKEHLPMKRILFWTKYSDTKPTADFDFGFGRKPFVEAGCKVTNCWTTSDRSWLNQSDALLFDAIEYIYNDLPRIRLPHQRYVYVHHEALPSTNPDKLNYDVFQLSKPHFFNWTMTHRRDSDILSLQPNGMLIRTSPYPPQLGQLPVKLEPGKLPSYVIPSLHPSIVEHKTKLMIYFASNCNTSSRREEYFKALNKHIPIDTFGKCGKFKCKPWNGEDCFKKKMPQYKFMLSSENSLCPDWIAQRFYRALKYGAVPVVYGVADYSAYAPPNSYIHAAEFASPKDLADYLLLLDRNDALYAKYFEWRKDWEVDRKPMIGWCELCEKLNDPSLPAKSYADLSKWWFQDGPCHPTEDFLNRLLPDRRATKD